MIFRSIGLLFASLVILAGLATRSNADQSLGLPKTEPVLTITGKIRNKNSNDSAVFDQAMLESFGSTKITTNTPWYEGSQTFEGVSIEKLLDAVGAEGSEVEAVGLDNYTMRIPVSDFTKFSVIAAMKRNGKPMTIRDKGPLMVIYPYDSAFELSTQLYYTRSVWQLTKIIVK